MWRIVAFCYLVFLLNICSSSNSVTHRNLYDIDLGGQIKDKVLTYSTMTDPVGIVSGQYGGSRGMFVSSFMSHSIYFISTEDTGHTNALTTPQRISGGSDSIDLDGNFGSASFAEPSRMAYDDNCKFLFVGTRRSMHIRVMRMQNHDVKTLKNEEGGSLSLGSPSQYTEFPGIDVQNIAGQALYVTNSRELFQISTADGHSFCSNIIDAPVVTPYYSLAKYMEVNGYDSNRARVYSVAPDQDRGCLYVAIADNKNVILKIPIEATLAREYSSIIKFVGDDRYSWGGDTSMQNPPVSSNGYAQSGYDVKLSFPMHIQYDGIHDYLYWSECFPFAGEFLLGSLAVRRLSLVSGLVDFYAGIDFTQDQTTYSYVGTEGGYWDAEVNYAEFRYPVSIAFARTEDNLGYSTGVIYVADRYNSAIRRVANVVGTASPTASFAPTPSPTRSYRPTPRPSHVPSTSYPTKSMRPTSTYSPTKEPTPEPTMSAIPTFNPTKRPTHPPTKYPTKKPSQAPTKIKVVVEDVSLFHTLGLGTYHVTTGALVLSTCMGLFVSVVIVAAYVYRNRNPHMRLRTSDISYHGSNTSSHGGDDGDAGISLAPTGDGGNGLLRTVRNMAIGLYDTLFGEDACVNYDIGEDVDSAMEMSDNDMNNRSWRQSGGKSTYGGDADSSTSMKRMLQTIREQSSHHSAASPSRLDSGTSSSAHYLDFDSTGRGSGGSTDRDGVRTSPMIIRSLGTPGDGL